MALFRHPSLVRGIVHTPHGAFIVVRRLVDVDDEIGEALGWEPVDAPARSASEPAGRAGRTRPNPAGPSIGQLDAH